MAEETTVVAVAPESTETSVAEETQPIVDMAAICKVVSDNFPEENLTTPEQCMQKLSEVLPLYNKERAAIKIINDAFESEPRLAAVINDWSTGKRKNFISAISAHFDPEEFTAGPEDEEELKAAISERTANKEAMQARMTELDANLEASRTNIEAFMNEKGLTPETIQPFVDFIDAAHKAFYDGKLTKAELSMLWNAYNHDGDVDASYTEGKTDGMNEQIVEKKTAVAKTDNVPVIVAASETAAAPIPKRKNVHNVRWEDNLKVTPVK